MEQQEFDLLVQKVGTEASKKIKSEMERYAAEQKSAMEALQANGGKSIGKDAFEQFQKSTQEALDSVTEIARKQGVTLAELQQSVKENKSGKGKLLTQAMSEAEDELRTIYNNRVGIKKWMVSIDEKGNAYAKPFDGSKAVVAGPNQTVGGTGSDSDTFDASVSQSIGGSSILRLGRDASIVSQFRNTPYLFDLCNVTTAGFDFPLATWWEEQALVGGSTNVAEGATKPITQTEYVLKTANYKKDATLIGFSEEFRMDFAQLYNDIIGEKGRLNVINRINTAILANVQSAATAYANGTWNGSTGTAEFPLVCEANDFDALVAMAAMVDNATFASAGATMANAALMSTFKRNRMGVEKDGKFGYLNPPAILNGMSFVGNPGVSGDNVIVGDFTKYNIILRGNFIVRTGWNQDDFARNRFSTVMEQFYYDYIPDIHKSAIVKGTTFANVKTLIGGGDCPCGCDQTT